MENGRSKPGFDELRSSGNYPEGNESDRARGHRPGSGQGLAGGSEMELGIDFTTARLCRVVGAVAAGLVLVACGSDAVPSSSAGPKDATVSAVGDEAVSGGDGDFEVARSSEGLRPLDSVVYFCGFNRDPEPPHEWEDSRWRRFFDNGAAIRATYGGGVDRDEEAREIAPWFIGPPYAADASYATGEYTMGDGSIEGWTEDASERIEFKGEMVESWGGRAFELNIVSSLGYTASEQCEVTDVGAPPTTVSRDDNFAGSSVDYGAIYECGPTGDTKNYYFRWFRGGDVISIVNPLEPPSEAIGWFTREHLKPASANPDAVYSIGRYTLEQDHSAGAGHEDDEIISGSTEGGVEDVVFGGWVHPDGTVTLAVNGVNRECVSTGVGSS
jgi:hypothetical protein